MADLPNTESVNVIQYAVAWEIAKMSVQQQGDYFEKSPEERTKILTNEYLKAFKALKDRTEID